VPTQGRFPSANYSEYMSLIQIVGEDVWAAGHMRRGIEEAAETDVKQTLDEIAKLIRA